MSKSIFIYGIDLDTLSIFDRLDKNNVDLLSLDYTFDSDTSIYLSNYQNKINGFKVSGKGILNSDSSLIRLVLEDNLSHEYLIYESSILFDSIGYVNFQDAFEETYMLNGIIPSKLNVQLIDADVTLKKIITYQLDSCKSLNSNKQYLSIKSEIEKEKLNSINKYIKKYKLSWAPHICHESTMPYHYKRKMYGDKVNTYGYEYYNDGFFSIPSKIVDNSLLIKSVTTTTFIDEFDWRDRHGKNWITPNKCQSGCYISNQIDCDYNAQDWNTDSMDCVNDGGEYRSVGTCWAFSAVGTLEAVTNLYFNQQINYDLSEQQVVSCAHGIAEAWYLSSTLNYIRDNYVVDESCYPYIAADGNCAEVCSSPVDRISFQSYTYISSESDLKQKLISNGPLAAKQYNWGHVLVCVGWGTVKVDDYIDYESGDVIQPGDPLIGSTYWILKQSNTKTGWPYHTGYIYMIDKPNYAYAINYPITSDLYNALDINCVDEDNDGYFNWGIGNKPSTCPYCAPNEQDGDDSDPNYGPMDSYGNLTSISQPYQFTEYEITATEVWSSDVLECGNIVVTSSGNLTINNGAEILLGGTNSFEVEVGGELLITEGSIIYE